MKRKAATSDPSRGQGPADSSWRLNFGARVHGGGTTFRVWAPRVASVAVRLAGDPRRTVEMVSGGEGTFEATVGGLGAGMDYTYVLDGGKEHPDPVSRHQPHGVHGGSRVVDPGSFPWTDQEYVCRALQEFVIYELHIGTFTQEGTFEAAISRLPHLRQLGVTAVEVMPIAEFPGGRNWGYDGVFLYAPQSTYGGPAGFSKLVNACHREGLAVILDVVYNHLGPEGNVLGDYAPYFTDRYRTPWGDALNFDGPESDGVRRFFVDNALYWLLEYHVDALRVDAIHGIFDMSARHILEEIASGVHDEASRLGRKAFLIAESDLNDPRVIRPRSAGGFGFDAQWNDDFHHCIHTAVAGTACGYLRDYDGLADLPKAITHGFVYDGRWSPSRRRRHGVSSRDRPGESFVVFIQNHDQVANPCGGKRLCTLVSPERAKLAAFVMLLCAPNMPMLFMGEEYGETAPFFYFTSHGDPNLVEAVRRGRKAEHASSSDEAHPDPQAEATFERSKLDWAAVQQSPHREMLRFYRDVLALRREYPCLSSTDKALVSVLCDEASQWLRVERRDSDGIGAFALVNLAFRGQSIPAPSFLCSSDAQQGEECARPPPRSFRLALFSGDAKYRLEPPAPPPRMIADRGGGPRVVLAAESAALFLGSVAAASHTDSPAFP